MKLLDKILYKVIIFLKNKELQYNLKSKLPLVQLGEKSVLHNESKINNLQKEPKKIKIGDGTHIRGELTIYPYGEGITIGDNSYIGENSVIRAASQIEIGNNVLIAHNVSIIDTDSHEVNHIERAVSYKKMLMNGHPFTPGNVKTEPIKIKDYAWISYNCSILKGVTIGEGAIIGAGSVVTHDVPPYSLAVGNPAKVIKELPH